MLSEIHTKKQPGARNQSPVSRSPGFGLESKVSHLQDTPTPGPICLICTSALSQSI